MAYGFTVFWHGYARFYSGLCAGMDIAGLSLALVHGKIACYMVAWKCYITMLASKGNGGMLDLV